MTEREADWLRPERMRDQAKIVLRDYCNKLPPSFRSMMQQVHLSPTPIERWLMWDLASKDRLASEIMSFVSNRQKLSMRDAVQDSLAMRSEDLIKQLKNCYAMELSELPPTSLSCFVFVLQDAAAIVADEVFAASPISKRCAGVSPEENLLG